MIKSLVSAGVMLGLSIAMFATIGSDRFSTILTLWFVSLVVYATSIILEANDL